MRKSHWGVLAAFAFPQLVLLGWVTLKRGSPDANWVLVTRYALETLAAGLIGAALHGLPGKKARAAFVAWFVAYFVVIIAQLISYDMTFAWIPRMAFENAENVKLVINRRSRDISICSALTCIAMLFGLLRARSEGSLKHAGRFALVALALLALDSGVKRMPTGERKYQQDTFHLKLRDTTPPVRSLVVALTGATRVITAKQESLEKVVQEKLVSQPFDRKAPYPFIRDRFYTSAPPFKPAHAERRKQNVLVIFAEGLSARTVNYYNDKIQGLTPNIDRFARDEASMAVLNYFNHTAATFQGLLGQLCSIHSSPLYGIMWRESKQSNYYCLPNVMRQNGYEATFLDPHPEEGDYLNDMLAKLGFDRVLTAEGIRPYVGRKPDPSANEVLSNHDLFDGLYAFLKVQAQKPHPFFVATYPFQTHAWVDTPEGGIKYGDGKNDALNTIHDLDAQFGAFWEKFKKLPVYKDTLVIFTTDHAHFHTDSFIAAVTQARMADYPGYFVDRIPLIIHDPRRELPPTFDAHYSTSLHFAPTLLHYLGVPNSKSPFLGTSLFERTQTRDVAGVGPDFFLIDSKGVLNISESDEVDHVAIVDEIEAARRVQLEDRLWPHSSLSIARASH